MPVAASLANLNYPVSPAQGANGHKSQSSSLLKLAESEEVLHRIITGSIRWHNGEEVIDIPAREIAQCAQALVKVIERRRLNLGKANPAPVKSEARRKRGPAGQPRVMPTPVGPGDLPIGGPGDLPAGCKPSSLP